MEDIKKIKNKKQQNFYPISSFSEIRPTGTIGELTSMGN